MVRGWRQETVKGKAKLVLCSLLPALIIFSAVELLASLSIHRSTQVTADPATGMRYYTMQIGRMPWGHQSVTALNSLGFPDREFDNILPKGDCVHVVFSGDSYVFGDGVDGEKGFFHLVKEWSARLNGRSCIRFFNIAERKATIEQQGQRIRETFSLLKPDIVILGQYQNDLTDLMKPGFIAHQLAGKGWMSDTLEPIRGVDIALVRFLAYHAFAFMIKHDIPYEVLHHWSVLEKPGMGETAEKLKRVYSGVYGALVRHLREWNVEFGVLILPSKFDLLAGRSPEEAFFVKLAEAERVPYLPLMPVLDSYRAESPYLLYDGHLSELGNFAVAKAIMQWLFESTPPPFAKLRRQATRPD